MPLIKDSGQLTHLGIIAAFVLFWIIVFFLLLRRKPKTGAFLVFFFSSFLFVGFTVIEFWPYTAWKLWSFVLTKDTTYYSLTITDAQGNVFVYDNHAAPPILPTQTNDLARRLLDPSYEKRARLLGTFLLERANSYRLELLANERTTPLLGLPAREFSQKWTADQMRVSGPFTEIIARRMHADFGSTRTAKPLLTVLEERRFK